jgi:hypothetical protein
VLLSPGIDISTDLRTNKFVFSTNGGADLSTDEFVIITDGTNVSTGCGVDNIGCGNMGIDLCG